MLRLYYLNIVWKNLTSGFKNENFIFALAVLKKFLQYSKCSQKKKSDKFSWFIIENLFGSIPNAQNSEKQILDFFNGAIFVTFSGFIALMTLYVKKDFAKNPTEKKPGNLKFEAEVKR